MDDTGSTDTPCTSSTDDRSRHRPGSRKSTGVTYSRRAYLSAGLATATTLLAGCSAGADDEGWQLPQNTNSSMVSEMDPAVIGRENGSDPARITVYTDFLCPDCARWNQRVVHALRQELIKPGRAVLYHRDFPLPVDEDLSWPASYAGRTVLAEGGVDAFWEFTADLYGQQDSVTSLRDLISIATSYGPGRGTVRRRINKQIYYPVVREDRRLGKENGVDGTPTVFVNDKMVNDPSADKIIEIILD